MELTDKWQAMDTEPINGGTVGGDGAGEAWSVRFGKRNPDGTYALITSSYYTVDIAMRYESDDYSEDTPARFEVENQTEYLVCTDVGDPGSTEQWSDYTYDNDITVIAMLESDADANAKAHAARELRMFDAFYSWDGSPK